MLLPLLLKEEFLITYFWAPEVDLAAVGAALHSIVTELRHPQMLGFAPLALFKVSAHSWVRRPQRLPT